MARRTFRDPSGSLYRTDDGLIRLVNAAGTENLEIYRNSKAANWFRDRGELIGHTSLSLDAVRRELSKDRDPPAAAIEHPVLSFVTHPYEWSPHMLFAAGQLTIDIALRLAEEDLVLKDAAADNIVFEWGAPVFVDALSFEKRAPGEAIWRAENQFLQHFIIPLLSYNALRLTPSQVFLSNQDGLSPAAAKRLFGFRALTDRTALRYVFLPASLESKADPARLYEPKRVSSEDKARFIFKHTLKRLQRALQRVRPRQTTQSQWQDYAQNNSYDSEAADRKKQVVKSLGSHLKGKIVLDVGTNTGEYAVPFAECGASVIAIDSDAAVIDTLWQRGRENGLAIQPVVQDIARPSPPVGWKNAEKSGFLERVRGVPDLVLMLGVVHHLMVGEGVPLSEIADLAADVTKSELLVEFVPRDDPMFRLICRGRDALYEWFTQEAFEAEFLSRFTLVERTELSAGGRQLYHLRLN